MSENENAGAKGENENQAGGAGDGGQGADGGAGASGKGAAASETVSKSEFDKVLKEMHVFKKKAQEAEKIASEAKLAKLKEENKWKEYGEEKEKEAKEARERSELLVKSFTESQRLNAVRVEATKLGIRPEAASDLNMLDLEEIQVETTNTGKVNVLGADKFAQRLKTLKPHWFQSKADPKINAGGNRVHDGSSGDAITATAVMKAEIEGKKKGDLTEYYALHKKFTEQKLKLAK